MRLAITRFLALSLACGAMTTGCALLGGSRDSSAASTSHTTSAEAPDHAASAPDVTFPEATKLLAQATPGFAANWGDPPPTVLRAYPLNPDWGMQRTPAGTITGRVTRSVLFIRGGKSGRCRQLLCNLTQEEQGGHWGQPVITCLPEYTSNVTCESVDGLRSSS
jgi:hypothetical protein